MKKLMMICGLLFSIVAFAQAQQGQGRQGGRMGMNPEARVKQLDEKLKLSEDQKGKLTTIFTEQADAQKKMREERTEGQGSGDRKAMMERMQKSRAELETKVTAVLNDEQKKAYKVMLDEQKAENEKRMKERQERQNP